MPRRLASLAACLCLLPALAACGGSGEEDEVKNAVNDLYAGFAERDADKVCGTLTEGQRQAVAKGGTGGRSRSCEQVMGFALGFVGDALKDADQAEVTKVEVDGDKAKATVKYKGKAGDLGLAKEGGDWKVSDFDLSRL
jgi:hypothetical protein